MMQQRQQDQCVRLGEDALLEFGHSRQRDQNLVVQRQGIGTAIKFMPLMFWVQGDRISRLAPTHWWH